METSEQGYCHAQWKKANRVPNAMADRGPPPTCPHYPFAVGASQCTGNRLAVALARPIPRRPAPRPCRWPRTKCGQRPDTTRTRRAINRESAADSGGRPVLLFPADF